MVLGRFVDHHPRTSSISDKRSMDGADRLVPGVATKALNQAFAAWANEGVKLVLSDSIRPTALNPNTLQAAQDAGFATVIIELDAPSLEIAKARWKEREADGGEYTAGLECKLLKCYKDWPRLREKWAAPGGAWDYRRLKSDAALQLIVNVCGARSRKRRRA